MSDLPLSRKAGIVNVGAAKTEEKEDYGFLVDSGRATLHLFEPDAAGSKELREHYGDGHRVHEHFIGDGQPGVFHETSWALTGSLLKPNPEINQRFYALHEFITPVKEHPVETKRLDDVIDEDVDVLKMDVQGAEAQILENAPETLSRLCYAQLEVNFMEMYQGMPMFADVDAVMRANGFMFHTFKGVGSRALKGVMRDNNPYQGFNQWLWADAIYVADFDRWDGLDSDKIAILAMMLDKLGSTDFSFSLRHRLAERTGTPFHEHYAAFKSKQAASPAAN